MHRTEATTRSTTSNERDPAAPGRSAGAPTPPGRPAFLVAVGILGLVGCVVLVGGSFLGAALVPSYSWVSDTISDLAVGPKEIVMDLALYGFAAALVATALGAAHLHLGGVGWTLGTFTLVLTAATTVVVGARNEYGDGDSEAVVIHIYLVYLLGILFAAGPFLMAEGAGVVASGYRVAFRLLGALWVVAAPVFFLVPTSWDGLYERLLGVIAVAWIGLLCWLFIAAGRRASRE